MSDVVELVARIEATKRALLTPYELKLLSEAHDAVVILQRAVVPGGLFEMAQQAINDRRGLLEESDRLQKENHRLRDLLDSLAEGKK